MQTFRPFRSTPTRQQKYYSQRKTTYSSQNQISIFNLPKQIIAKHTIYLPNQEQKQIIKKDNKFVQDYQENLRKTVFNHSKQIHHHKKLHRATQSLIQHQYQKENIKNLLQKKTDKNKQKNISFETLNILYRTIIQTKVRQKSKQTFELNAKRLPILGKLNKSSSKSNKLQNNQTIYSKQMILPQNSEQKVQQKQSIRRSQRFSRWREQKNHRKTNQKYKNEIKPWQNPNQLEYEYFY